MTCDINVLLFIFQQTHTLVKPAKRANLTIPKDIRSKLNDIYESI